MVQKSLWLEIIKIRSSRDDGGMVRDVAHTLKSDPAVREAKEVRAFSNAVGDIAIHISWESDRAETAGSPIGLQLAAALAEYGPISHTIWIEEV
jgi:hypothetical protein